MKLQRYNIQYNHSITSWDEGLPLGNGRMGCLLYGDSPVRLSVDRVDLWDTRPYPATLEKGFCYKNLVKLSTSGKKDDWEERDRLFERIYSEYAYPSKITAGRMELDKTLYHNALLEIERLGMGMWVGFSYAMCAQIYAMAEQGNAAYEKLRQFADGFVADNGFHLNGDFRHKGYSTFHYRPFTLESLFGYCDALQEMLMQEHQGYLHLFPAVPEAWQERKISFERLRSYGGVLVSATASGGCLEKVTLELPKPMELKLKNTFKGTRICVQSPNEKQIIPCQNDIFALSLPAGVTTITPMEGEPS